MCLNTQMSDVILSRLVSRKPFANCLSILTFSLPVLTNALKKPFRKRRLIRLVSGILKIVKLCISSKALRNIFVQHFDFMALKHQVDFPTTSSAFPYLSESDTLEAFPPLAWFQLPSNWFYTFRHQNMSHIYAA